MTSERATIIAVAGGIAGIGSASAQVVINEVFENPPNGGDQTWEYIELHGPAGYDLTGYAVALIKGGEDDDGDDIPDGASQQNGPEIDEVFTLDGWTVGPSGFFVIYNTGSFAFTSLTPYLTENPDWSFFLPESPENKRFLDGASFATLHVPSVDAAGKLENDTSSTYLLVRRRPHHSIDASGSSVYGEGYAWKKDVSPDVDFNSRIDFGDEHTLGVPVFYAEGLEGDQTTALELQPVQIVDEVAWSNLGGKEFNTPGRGVNGGKITETPGYNPDAVSRVRYLSTNPMTGWTIENGGELERSSLADESWVSGETVNIEPGLPDYTLYKPLYESGEDTILGTGDDELNHLAPTDPAGPTYSYDGPGDDNPLAAPFLDYSGALDPVGDLRFNPYDISEFRITPAGFNDAPAGTPLASTDIGRQFRFIPGDLTFDGTVDSADLELAESLLGAGLDDTAPAVRDRNTDDPSDDSEYEGWAHQLTEFNALLALVRMDLTDGTTGEWNSGVAATQADVDAVRALVPGCSPADIAAPFGILDLADINVFVAGFVAGDPAADINRDGVFDLSDINAFVGAFTTGCG